MLAASAQDVDSEDPLVPFVDSGFAAAPQPDAPLWRILVVDDDEDVHVATQIALRDMTVEGRGLSLLHARSAAEAFAHIAGEPDLACVLLDVVMETPDAGLRLVTRIRRELGRHALRIILRTGQPGYAPEIETLRDFDINDYRTKSELTRVRLYSSLSAAIRAYAQLAELTRQRDELARVNAALERARAAERAQAAGRLAAEQALREAESTMGDCVAQRTRELSQLVAELDSFNRMVAHDLSGPLHGLAGLSEMIQRELGAGDPVELRRWLGMMGTQTRRLAELVDELLHLSRISHGELKRAPVALSGLVQQVLETLTVVHGPAAVARIEVGPLPELALDAGLIRQVLVNLLSNALKFTREVPAPHIELNARRGDGEWVIEVRDNGAGFDPQRAAQLFRPFVRLHDGRFEGSGIGLTIAQRVVERHGGRIRAESRPGAGATFSFTLPDID